MLHGCFSRRLVPSGDRESITQQNEVGGRTISSRQSRPFPYWPACSTRGNERSRPHSMPRGVQEYSDPSLGGFHSSRRAGPPFLARSPATTRASSSSPASPAAASCSTIAAMLQYVNSRRRPRCHDRGSSPIRLQGRKVHHQPGRGRDRRHRLGHGTEARGAAGPGHHPGGRDAHKETFNAAMHAAETGHLVFGKPALENVDAKWRHAMTRLGQFSLLLVISRACRIHLSKGTCSVVSPCRAPLACSGSFCVSLNTVLFPLSASCRRRKLVPVM